MPFVKSSQTCFQFEDPWAKSKNEWVDYSWSKGEYEIISGKGKGKGREGKGKRKGKGKGGKGKGKWFFRGDPPNAFTLIYFQSTRE